APAAAKPAPVEAAPAAAKPLGNAGSMRKAKFSSSPVNQRRGPAPLPTGTGTGTVAEPDPAPVEEKPAQKPDDPEYEQLKKRFRSVEEGISASTAAISAELEAVRATMNTWHFSERGETPPPQAVEKAKAERQTAPRPQSAVGSNRDYSATLGLSGALSLEEILRNVQELEKCINKESELKDEE
ncbi:MAG: hypothetical protein Q4B50_05955, partial [Bacillota bacterium]|nr:hypothetical protein [Bacillota bacterium]